MPMQVRAKVVRDRWTVEPAHPVSVRPDAATSTASVWAPLVQAGATLLGVAASASAVAVAPLVTGSVVTPGAGFGNAFGSKFGG